MSKIKLATRLSNFEEYVFSKWNKRVAKVEEESGRKILNLGQGDPDVRPSNIYIDKFCEFVRDPKSHLYPGYGAQKHFSESLINWYKKRFNVQITKDELYPILGAKDAVSHIPLALLDKGDEILVPDPGYSSFAESSLMVGAKPIYYNLTQKNNFKIDFNELESKISSKTKYIVVNYPSNPTGQVINKAELQTIADLCVQNNIILIYDNAYSEITFDNFVAPSILEISGAKDYAIELGSFSKTFSFAGFRMGWIAGNSEIVQGLAKIKSQMDSGMSTHLQKLGSFVFNNFDQDWHNKMIATYQARANIVAKYLKKLGCKFSMPKGSIYIWAQIPESAKNCEEFCLNLLEQKQVLIAPGTAFGKNGSRFVRASICTDISKIEEYL